MHPPKLLITGGAGYIGSHFVESCLRARSDVQLVILDNLSAGHIEFVHELQALARSLGRPEPLFEQVDLLDADALDALFALHKPELVLHFAAKISIAESVEKPELYFKNNLIGSQILLQSMQNHGCKKLVFSSTAAVYGMVQSSDPITEAHPVAPINPYGESKLKMEEAIQQANREWGLNAIIFRYFNACGASSTAKIGEWHEPETHLVPLLIDSVLAGHPLNLYGNDYPTRDGTCIRDYIHVSDLAEAHLLGVERLMKSSQPNSSLLKSRTSEYSAEVQVYNLGTESGISVLEMIHAAERVTGKQVQYKISPRRAGDAAVLVASSAKAREELGWRARNSSPLTILKTALGWQDRQ